MDPPPQKKGGMKRTQKYQNVLRHFLGPKHHFLQACDTWIPHKTKLPNYLQKINSILGIFSFFNFWQGFTVVFDANVFFLIFFFFSKMDPPKGGMERTQKYQNILGHFLGPKYNFLQAYDIQIPHKKKLPKFFALTVKKSHL